MSGTTVKSWMKSALVWLAFIVFHLALVLIDWSLRDKQSDLQPMPGGIPWAIDTAICWVSIFGIFVAAILALPSTWSYWIRVPAGLIQSAAAFAIIIIGRLYYVLNSGIDTL